MKHYDTIIIGGGLAGCTLGYLLKKAKKNVLIIEKQDSKLKSKLCGGLLTKKSYDLLQTIYGSKDINKLSITKYTKATMSNNNKEFMIENINTFSIFRKELDDFVLNKYLNLSGEILDNTIYKSIDFKNNIITLNNEKYSFDYIVGADGVFSQLRKDVTKRKQRNNFALEIYDTSKKYNSINISFFNNFKGYGWIITNSKYNLVGIVNVNRNHKLESEFDHYLKNLNINNNHKKGAFLPSGDDIFLTFKNNVFFIGDSAGLISPITGEGIYYALYSAYVLSKNMNLKYKQNMNIIIKNMKKDMFYLKFVYNDKLRNYLFSRYNNNKFITKLINRFAKHIL